MLAIDEMLVNVKKEVLVEMVKLAQKKGMTGSKGTWKEFLDVFDPRFGTSLSDPSRRNVESLTEFLKTFSEEEDLKFFKKVLQSHANRVEVEQLEKTAPDNITAEEMLVRLTLDHPLYLIDYDFPTQVDEEWVLTHRKKKAKVPKTTIMIAIDCEMVLCEDGTEALVKVCAVDRDLQVILDEVVNPNKEIADYRTAITGITAKDLEGVTYSLKDVQKKMRRLLSKGTILVGHSLNNDLKAMKIDHQRVIDTSYIFKYANGPPTRRASLSFLCKAMLGYDLRNKGNPHNCLDDACAAMKLVLAKLEGKIEDVIVISEELKEEGKLFVHRIPQDISGKDLQSIISGDFTVEVKANKKKHSTTYSAFAIFKNFEEASEAYENLEGELVKDTHGRPQKCVRFTLDSGKNAMLCVCKSMRDDPIDLLKSNKRALENGENTGGVKKLKTEGQHEGHVEEIERLKKEVSERDEVIRQRDGEISNLNKIIATLVRKQGL